MNADRIERDWARFAVSGIGVVLAAAILWRVLYVVLSADRGLDITDEGLYLLAADPPSLRATWSFPSGWHTGPLFRLVGYDVASFRTLGAFVLVVASASLGWAAVSLGLQSQNHRSTDVDRRFLTLCGAAIGALGSLVYYAALLRTPSYNWANLIGITVAATGQLFLIESLRSTSPRIATSVSFALLSSFGVFYTLPAKPSSAVFALVAGAVVSAPFVGCRNAIIWSGRVALMTVGWILAALWAGFWPRGFSSSFSRAIAAPTLVDAQSLPGAVAVALRAPLYPSRYFLDLFELRADDIAASLGLVTGALLLGALVWFVRNERAPAPARSAAKWLVVLALVLLVFRLTISPISLADAPSVRPWGQTPLALSALFLLLASALATLRVGRTHPSDDCQRDVDARGESGGERWAHPTLVGYLIALPFAFAFGTASDLYAQASAAAGFFLIAIVSVIARAPVGGRPIKLRSCSLLLLTLVYVASTLVEAQQNPYRTAALSEQVVPIELGPRDRRLLVDRDLSQILQSLESQAVSMGWSRGEPMVGIEWRWSTTIPYWLGARVPDSLMLTLFGYPGSVSVAEHHLADTDSDFRWSNAWVLVSAGVQEPQVGLVIEALALRSGRDFPSGYECVAAVAEIELWRPRLQEPGSGSLSDSMAQCPPPQPATSQYDSIQGWTPRTSES